MAQSCVMNFYCIIGALNQWEMEKILHINIDSTATEINVNKQWEQICKSALFVIVPAKIIFHEVDILSQNHLYFELRLPRVRVKCK